MNRQVRTTVVFGLISALGLFPLSYFFGNTVGHYYGFELALWSILAGYSLLLARWSKTPLLPVGFPLAVLFILTLVSSSWAPAFVGLALVFLGWIRSGVCFKAPTLRLMVAEAVTLAGGAALVGVFRPSSPVAISLTLWLFFLIQALYFFLLPGGRPSDGVEAARDPFASALRAAEKIVG